MIPKIDKRYNCFDDGKITNSRLYTVDISEIIPFDDIDKETLELWNIEVESCDWLYAKETDYFVKYTNGENDEDGVFARTKDGGWFGLGNYWNSGRLDIDGTLTERLKENKK